MTTSKLLLPELSVSQASKEITHNQALAIIDQVTQARVLDKDLTAPPGSPANGAAYIVAAGASGAWAGKDGKIAYWLSAVGAWSFANPLNGWLVYVDDENKHYRLESGAWVQLVTGGGMTNPMTTLGDLIKGGASGTPSRLPVGANGQVLTVVAGEPAWAASSGGGADNSTETVVISAGALNLSATTKETIVVSLNANVTSITMPSGAGGQVVNRRVVFTNTGSFTVSGWTGVTIEGGVAPTAATGAGAVTEYMLSNVNNGGWRMYVDQTGGVRNKIINGKMEIAQRGTSFPAIASNGYSVDRWRRGGNISTAVMTWSQQADAPSGNEFQSSLRVTVTTADASVASGDNESIFHAVEGYNALDLIGRTFTLSFWVRSSKTGVHCVSFANNATDRSYIAEYSVSAANTWEYKSVTVIGGLITAGGWDWTNGTGISIRFPLLAGTSFHTTAGSWQAGNFLCTANQVNCLDTVGNIFAITGVQLQLGSAANAFDHRPYAQELALCQRYYWKSFLYATTPAQNSGAASTGIKTVVASASAGGIVNIFLPVPMRATPTITTFNPSAANVNWRDITNNVDVARFLDPVATETKFGISFGSGATLAASLSIHAEASAEL